MRHIIKPLLHHYLMPLLVILQVALASAIACNALFLLQQKLTPVLAPDGIGDPGHLIVVSQVVARGKLSTHRLHEAGVAMRALPGVASVSVAGALPMATNSRFSGDVVGMDTHAKAHPAVYVGTHLVDTLGLKLVAGRNFNAAEEAVDYKSVGFYRNGPTIITRALADKLFPGQRALGKRIRIGESDDGARRTVVGVVAHLMRNDFGSGKHRNLDYTMLFPGIPGKWPLPAFGVRMAATASSKQVIEAVKGVVKRVLGPQLVPAIDPHYELYSQLRDRALAKSRAAVWLLAGVCVIVLVVTLAGIMGLTSYWVGQRTRHIGIRRALGAQRRDIMRDLQWENLLVVGVGVVLGLIAAYGVNLWLMQHYELSRLPWQYLPAGAALLLVLGQLAVLGPALRASRVPPVVATRSV